MADKRYKDFDSATKESEKEPIQVKLNEKIYTFPPALPARTVLAQMRWMDQKVVFNFVDEDSSIVGEETMEEILDEGATWTQLEELLQYLLQEYQIVQDVDEEVEVEPEEGEDDTPK